MHLTKIKIFRTKKQIACLIALFVLIGFSRVHPLFAQAVSQGYKSDQALQRGMLVKLNKDDPTKVEALNTSASGELHGVVISPGDAPFSVAGEGQEVYVASTGKYEVLVSDQNGGVKTGDYVTISALDGIGMKTGSTQLLALGKALSDFDGQKNSLSKAKIKDADGQEKEVDIGLIVVDINIVANPQLQSDAQVPGFLKKASEAVAGKAVGANKVYIGVVMLVLTSIIAAVVLYAGVRSSIIALGRNPLSKKTIIKGMIQVVIISLIIFLLGLFGVYLLLRL